jgi:hypothetical protein
MRAAAMAHRSSRHVLPQRRRIMNGYKVTLTATVYANSEDEARGIFAAEFFPDGEVADQYVPIWSPLIESQPLEDES